MKILETCLVALVVVLPAAADMYRWTDENGKVHYSDSPPPGKKAKKLDLRINSISGPPVVSAFTGSSANRTTAAASKVKMYSASWCGYCKRAKAYLQARGTRFEEVDVESSPQAAADFRSIGGRGVPVILVGGQRMDGYTQESLEAMLKQVGL